MDARSVRGGCLVEDAKIPNRRDREGSTVVGRACRVNVGGPAPVDEVFGPVVAVVPFDDGADDGA